MFTVTATHDVLISVVAKECKFMHYNIGSSPSFQFKLPTSWCVPNAQELFSY